VVSDRVHDTFRQEEFSVDKHVENESGRKGTHLIVAHLDKLSKLLLALAGHLVNLLFLSLISETFRANTILFIGFGQLFVHALNFIDQVPIRLHFVLRFRHLDFALAFG